MKDRCAIETEYASKLKRLAKHYNIKKKDDEDNQYTYFKAFLKMLEEITHIANQHEMIADTISGNIVRDISFQVKELKDERKKHLTEGQKLHNNYNMSINLLDKAKKSYEKAFKDSERALEAYHKADADLNLSRAEVEKAKNYSHNKGQICDDTKTEYANQLQKTNDLQRKHFTQLLPTVFNSLQEMEERRISAISSYMKQSAQIHKNVFPIIGNCLDEIINASESINPSYDSSLVIEQYKSGNFPPDDIPFEDLSNPCDNDTSSSHLNNSSGENNYSCKNITSRPKDTLHYRDSVRSETLRGTINAGKLKVGSRIRGGILGIFTNKQVTTHSLLSFSSLC